VTSLAAPINVSSKSTLGQRIALKEDCETVRILRHERGLPAGPAALVEQIRQGIFVLARVERKLDYDSLVFFHRTIKIMTSGLTTNRKGKAKK
jgi:hypothetical protein